MDFEQEVLEWVNKNKSDRYSGSSYQEAGRNIIHAHKTMLAEGKYVLDNGYYLNYVSGSGLFAKFFKIHDIRFEVMSGSSKGSIGRVRNMTVPNSWSTEYTLAFKDGKSKKFKREKLQFSVEEITDLYEISSTELAPNDMLGRKIKLGDFAAYASKTYGMTIGNISKISKEGKVYIKPLIGGKIGRSWVSTTESRVEYPNELIILDDQTFKEFMLLKLQRV